MIKRQRDYPEDRVACHWFKMMSHLVCFVAVLFVGASATLQWPESYSATGFIYLPYAEVNEPFTVVMDAANKRSLTSTYNGMRTLL